MPDPHASGAEDLADYINGGRMPYITITKGGAGWFAVCLWWNNTGEGGLPGFWEPYESGHGRYADAGDAIEEGKAWATSEDLKFIVPADFRSVIPFPVKS